MTSEKEIDNFKDGFQSEFITKTSNVSISVLLIKYLIFSYFKMFV